MTPTTRKPSAKPPTTLVDPLQDSVFMRACRRQKVSHTPIWLMRQAGRYMPEYRQLREKVGFLELCKSSELACQVTVDAATRLGVDAAILFADILLVVEPLGMKLEFNKGEGPSLDNPIRSPEQVDALRAVAVHDSLGYVMQTVKLVRAALPAGMPLIGFSGAPFTLASYMIEGGSSRNFLHTKQFMYREPRAWNALLKRLAQVVTDYLTAQIQAGVQAVQLFDSWVGNLGPADYRTFVMPHVARVIRGLPKGVPVIHFGVGTGALLELMKEAGGDVIGLDFHVDFAAGWKRLGSVAVQGNLDPVALYAEPAYLKKRAKEILEAAGGKPGHIFNLGHGILPTTPVDNVLRLVDYVHTLSAR
jgi:uroporphyrinogen decarboxylase